MLTRRISARLQAIVHAVAVSSIVAMMLAPGQAAAQAGPIQLADQPLFSTNSVPGNLLLALSVEWPTASTPAYLSTSPYSAASTYVGYFDPQKCYRYVVQTPASSSYFTPATLATNHACASSSTQPLWSGNYLNWTSTQTLDAFRWALTGGPRAVDTATETILEKTNHSGQGGHGSIYPDKALTSSVDGATPFNWASATTRIWKGGTAMWITGTGSLAADPLASTDYTGENSYTGPPADASTVYKVYIRVKVCDASSGLALESNCVAYGSQYKPEGLMQKYAMTLRYSTFGYLNDGNALRDGGVMRARMKYIGPAQPVPGSADVTNASAEWSATDGTMLVNPDTADATSTTAAASSAGYNVTITNSGVMNYLNKFGKVITGNYKDYDPVSEMYYAGLRYFRNLGNVSEYSNLSGAGSQATLARWLDGFPVIGTWDDPMLYSCQKNFVLGIGDVNTWNDANLNGSTIRTNEPTTPSAVSSDTSVDVKTATDMVGTLEGIANLGSFSSGRNNSYFMAGLAYDAHTRDIRADLTGMQTVNTYWLDVMEGQTYLSRNQYWLAAKYGGFEVPAGFSTYATSNGPSTLADNTWATTADMTGSNKRPDNYFLANQADRMVSGLTAAFAKISAEAATAVTTAFSLPAPNFSSSGTASYAASYDPSAWTGVLTASTLTIDPATGVATAGPAVWDAGTLLDSTAPGNRKIVTCCSSAGAGLRFTGSVLGAGSLHPRTYYTSFASVPGAASQSASDYVDYLRGDRTNEAPAGRGYRARTHVLGDIVGSKANPVGPPGMRFQDATNPGYSAFMLANKDRKTVVYVGSNDGMMHAFDGTMPGATTCATCGTELFAYVPSFAYGTSTTAATTGLASYGNPSFVHHYFVNATPLSFDLDFHNTPSATGTGTDWRTILIGGLGKGGKGYYAIDITRPADWTSEDAVAGKVLWEFTDTHMGYSYGDASVVKTAKYGWVVILTSGYNNDDGRGYFFIVNPRTGELLERIATPSGTAGPINMAGQTAFISDYTDFTADAVYAGDLQGNVWRLDVTGTPSSYAEPTLLARVTMAGVGQPVTTRPLIEVDPASKKRYVMFGTGRLLADSDIANTQIQSFYAIIDGTGDFGGFFTAATLPSGAFPVTRANLNANTDLTAGIGSAPANSMGWYTDFGASSTGIGERLNIDPVANSGSVAFGVNLPSGQACTWSGSHRASVLDFGAGRSVLLPSGSTGGYTTRANGLITEMAIVNSRGKLRYLAGDSTGQVFSPQRSDTAPLIPTRLNWREVPAVD